MKSSFCDNSAVIGATGSNFFLFLAIFSSTFHWLRRRRATMSRFWLVLLGLVLGITGLFSGRSRHALASFGLIFHTLSTGGGPDKLQPFVFTRLLKSENCHVWPWRWRPRSMQTIKSERPHTTSYLHSIVTMCLSLTVFKLFNVKAIVLDFRSSGN